MLAKKLTGEEKVKALIYARFFRMSQYKLDKKVKKLMPVAAGNTALFILSFLGIALVYFIYDLIKCIKEDKDKYQ